MPTILKVDGFRFHFYSNEGNEPPHIHIEYNDGECKFWLEPIVIAKNIGIKQHDIRKIEKLVFENAKFLIEKYNEFHNIK